MTMLEVPFGQIWHLKFHQNWKCYWENPLMEYVLLPRVTPAGTHHSCQIISSYLPDFPDMFRFLPFTNFHDGWQLRCTASFWQSGLGGMADVITFNAALSRALGKLRPETTGVTRVRRVVSSHGNHLPLKIVIQNHWRWSSKDDPHQVAPEELGFYGISWDFQIFIPPHSWIFVAGCDFFRASLAIRRMCESLRLCLPDLPGDRSQESPRFIEFPGFHKLQYQIWGSKYIKMEQHESIYVHLCPSMSIYVHLCPMKNMSVGMMTFPIYIYMSCEPYLLHNAIDGVFLPRSPVP